MTIDRRRAITIAYARQLRAERKARGLSQEELAELAGIDRTFPSKLETGVRSPTIYTFEAIALALKLDPPTMLQKILEMA